MLFFGIYILIIQICRRKRTGTRGWARHEWGGLQPQDLRELPQRLSHRVWFRKALLQRDIQECWMPGTGNIYISIFFVSYKSMLIIRTQKSPAHENFLAFTDPKECCKSALVTTCNYDVCESRGMFKEIYKMLMFNRSRWKSYRKREPHGCMTYTFFSFRMHN